MNYGDDRAGLRIRGNRARTFWTGAMLTLGLLAAPGLVSAAEAPVGDQAPLQAPDLGVASVGTIAPAKTRFLSLGVGKPGEISLAHQGVLFLDELPEFDPRVLDSLRQPLENGEVSVSRANHRVTYPARFMLVAAMNPCRCGNAFEPGYACKRGRIDRCTGDYQARISGPLMDRIDLRIEVPAVTAADLILPPPAEGSAEVAARVAAARDIQLARYADIGLPNVRTNAEAPASVLEDIAKPDAQGAKLLRDAAETMRLSARGYHRVLRVARTLADLDNADKIGRLHLAEALSYRALAEDVRQMA